MCNIRPIVRDRNTDLVLDKTEVDLFNIFYKLFTNLFFINILNFKWEHFFLVAEDKLILFNNIILIFLNIINLASCFAKVSIFTI